MAKQFTVISGNRETSQHTVLLPEERFEHWRNVVGAVLEDAQTTWGELWKELQGKVIDGCMVLPQAEKGFAPECGWPEFLEKMWLLKHYLDYASRFSKARK